jgi:hypothetical protein
MRKNVTLDTKNCLKNVETIQLRRRNKRKEENTLMNLAIFILDHPSRHSGAFPFAMVVGGWLSTRFGPRMAILVGCAIMVYANFWF